jgi:hypothetical protein
MVSIPALQTVLAAKRHQLGIAFVILAASMLIAFLLSAVFKMSAWMLLMCMLGGSLLAVLVSSRMFIRWRLQAYEEAQNIRQLHLVARLSDMESTPDFEILLSAISSRTEVQRWKELLARANTSSLCPFPEATPPERVIGRSQQGLWVLLVSLAFCLVIVLGIGLMSGNYTLFFCTLGLMFFTIARLVYRARSHTPVVVLSTQGILFPENERILVWDAISGERIEKEEFNESWISKLTFQYQGQTETYKTAGWKISLGELRYLLLWYRHAYEMDAETHRHDPSDDHFLFTTS